MKAAALSVVATIAVGLLLGGSQAFAHTAAAPPSLVIEVIGGGKVTGTGINCGLGVLACAATYSDTTGQQLTATAASGWTFQGWEDGCSGNVSPCTAAPAPGGRTVTANFARAPGLTLNYQTFAVSLSSVQGEVFNNANNNITCGDTDNDPNDDEATPDGDGPHGGLEGVACTISVPQTSTITVQAQPDDGYLFNGWGGSCSGTKPFCSTYLAGDQSVSADFLSSSSNLLTVNVDGSGTVSGGGITCTSGETCTKQEPPTTTITLAASPASGYAFTGWSGGCSGLQTTCTVQMTADRSVTASFDPLVPINVTVNGAGTVSGANVTCGPGPQMCNGTAAPNSKIQLQATPTAAGGTVTWTGCTSSAGSVCNLSVGSSPLNVTATFSGGTTGGGSFVQLSVVVDGNGYVTATGATLYCTAAGGSGCVATVQQNATVTLRAVPASGISADFDAWSGCPVATSTSCTLTMSAAKQIAANFDNPDNTTYDLTASIAGRGTVSGAGLNCRTTGSAGCTSPQAATAQVAITAVPSSGGTFAGWSGACSGTSPTCTVTMDSDKNVTATFKPAAASSKLTIRVGSAGTVSGAASRCVGKAGKTTTCITTEEGGAALTLKATPAKGYVFSGWAGACSGTKTTCSVVMSSDTEVLATFKPAPIAAGAKKPTVTKVAGGYRITLSYRAGEAGRLTVTTKPATVTISKTIKAGAGTLRLTVKKHARYVITLSLKSKSGTHTLRYTVKV